MLSRNIWSQLFVPLKFLTINHDISLSSRVAFTILDIAMYSVNEAN